MGYDATLMVEGLRPPDDEYEAKAKAWLACKAAGIEPPEELDRFFNGEPPPDEGMRCCLGEAYQVVDADDESGMVTGVRNGGRPGYVLIDVRKLPKKLTHLRIYIYESY